MADEGFKRKLTAILSADVEGYSRLMDDDEAATVRTLTAYRSAITDLVQKFSGRVVDSPGDNILAEFTSVVDAVSCAAEIQRDLAERNVDLPDERKMQFRIGVNLGDVIDEEERIYGDGVNIAARIESLSDAGGICISHSAYDQIKNKLKFGYEYLGEHEVKNIREPVKAYRVLLSPEFEDKLIGFDKKASNKKWIWLVAAAVVLSVIGIGIWQFYVRRPAIEPVSVEKMALPLPDKPSIVVLPFDNLSGDSKEDYFSDGLTEQIITTLSVYPRLFVIARQSAFHYKGTSTKIQKVAEELGVRYVLKGGVQKSGEKIRITVQLIDAISGNYIWSERYDRELKDLFDLQDEITVNVLKSMVAELTEGEEARRWTKRVDNLEALEKHYRGQAYFCRHTKEDYDKARPLFEEAIALEPEFVWPYVYLGSIHTSSAARGWSDSRAKSLQKASELAQKALAIDDSHDGAHFLSAVVYLNSRKYDKAFSEAKRAVALNPNGSTAYMILGATLASLGRWEESVLYAEKSIRLSPFPGAMPFLVLGRAYFMTDQYDESIATLKKALNVSPNFVLAHIFLAACYSSVGRDAEARAAAKKVLRINPKFTIESYAKRLTYSNKADIDREVNALRKAGLPYTPPLPLPDKPSIAVLAFDNLSGDPVQEYFSDGISENIITALSKVGELFVIARNSSFTYKGKPVKVQQVGRELGVRYVLEGSVQKSGDRVRITAQLIDAKDGQHLWAEKYDRELKDIFEIQDELTMKIVIALRVELTEGEVARISSKRYKNLDVYLKAVQVNSLWNDGSKESLIRLGQLAQEIVDMEPDSSVGYLWLGWYHYSLADRAISPKENFKKAFAYAQKVLTIDESDAHSHALLCWLYSKVKKIEKAIESGKRSVELMPNGNTVNLIYGSTLVFAERFDEGIVYIKQAIRLHPFPPYYFYINLGRCYYWRGQYEEALGEYQKALQRAPDNALPHFGLAITYIKLNREEEARLSAAKALEIFPNFTVTLVKKTWRYKTQSGLEDYIDAMRRAGFPE